MTALIAIMLSATLLSICFGIPAKAQMDAQAQTQFKSFIGNGTDSKSRTHGYLEIWRGRPVVATTRGVEGINSKENRLEDLELKIPGNVIKIGVTEDGRLIALSFLAANSAIYIEAKSGWQRIDLPPQVRKRQLWEYSVGVHGDSIFVASHDTIFINQKGKWTPTYLKVNRSRLGGRAPSIYFKANQMYLAFASGEFGGGLVQIDLKTGAQKLIFSGLPVLSLVFANDGSFWFTATLSHITTIEGSLYHFKDGMLTLISSIDCVIDRIQGSMRIEKKKNWNFGPTCFNSVVLDKSGNPVMATSSEGILEYSSGRWKRLSQRWPFGISIERMRVLPDGQFLLYVKYSGLMSFQPATKRLTFVKEK